MNFFFHITSTCKVICALSLIGIMLSCKTKKRAIDQIILTKHKKLEPTIKLEPMINYRSAVDQYIHTYKDWAIHEMNTYGIPASITLAQGLLESRTGKSILTIKGNNHFGIKCHSNWNGKKIYHNDDRRKECFRSYSSPLESFTDHSAFLKNRRRYSFLFSLDPTDYKAWAYGLKRAGYATDKKYPEKLITLIERHGLYQYDNNANSKLKSRIKHNKNKKWIRVKRGDTLYSISKKYELSVYKLKKINGLKSNKIQVDQILYVK